VHKLTFPFEDAQKTVRLGGGVVCTAVFKYELTLQKKRGWNMGTGFGDLEKTR